MKFSILISAIALLLLTAACVNKKEKSDHKDTLTIGVMSSMDYLPIAVAHKNGYFTNQELEVVIQKFYSPNDRDAALQSNNLDGTILDYTGGAIQLSGGIPLHFTSQCDGTFELMVNENSGITSIADLQGKKIAISRNTVIDFCTDLALKKAGLTEKDVELIEINKIPLRLEMLDNVKIDGTMLPDPFATIAKGAGNGSIISMSDLNVRVTGMAFLQKTIDDKSEALRKFYRAYDQAVEEINSKGPEELREILTKELGFPDESVALVTLPKFGRAQLPHPSDLQAVQTWLNEKGLVKSDFDIHHLVADGFTP